MIIKWKQGGLKLSEDLKAFPHPASGSFFVWAQGYFFDGDRMLVGDEIAEWLSKALGTYRFETLIPRMNGTFVAGLCSKDTGVVQFGTSRYGGINIYQACGPDFWVIGDDFWQVARESGYDQYDPLAVTSMLVYGSVLGDNTLLQNISVLSNAAIYSFDPEHDSCKPKKQFYFSGGYHPEDSDPVQLRKKAGEVLHTVFRRYASAYDERGWKVRIPLSGGLDSRLAAAMLVWGGAQVESFSYGPTNNSESVSAQKTADALGIPVQLFAIDDPALYTHEIIHEMTRAIGMKARFTAGIGARLFLKEYDPQTVYITGHPANLPVGDATRRGANLIRTREQLRQHLSDNHKLPIFEDQLSRLLPTAWEKNQNIPDLIPDDLPFHKGDPIGTLEWWELKYHFHNLLAMEMVTYSHFGQIGLPFCDYELFDFYNTVPFDLRFQRNLHVDAVLNEVFVDGLAKLKEVPMANGAPLSMSAYRLRDRILFNIPASFVGDWILNSQSQSKQRGRRIGMTLPVTKKYGPDPLDWWWTTDSTFQGFIYDHLQGWGGMNGMIDVDYLLHMLKNEQQHAIFYRYGLAALLTLKSFEDINTLESKASLPSQK